MSTSTKARNEYERLRAEGHYDLGDDTAYITDRIAAERHIEMCIELLNTGKDLPDYLQYLLDSLERFEFDDDNDVVKNRLFSAFKLEKVNYSKSKKEKLFRNTMIRMNYFQGVPIDAPAGETSLIGLFCMSRKRLTAIINNKE